jgi:hypothetical protein
MILMTPLQYDFVSMMERVVIYFHHFEYARFERDTLLLEWSIGTIRIRGPKAEVFSISSRIIRRPLLAQMERTSSR